MSSQLAPKLADVLVNLSGGTIAVSGGVDSLTLSSFAHLILGSGGIRMIHARSPAVPRAATKRVRQFAAQEAWRLDEVDAGEFLDPRYRANPVNRCFFCKSNLYLTLGDLSDGVLLSGTNTDDLHDYRPGLQAAKNHNVRHPFVEAGLSKDDIRALARAMGHLELSKLPSSPCLSSRIETGLVIEPDVLTLVDRVEELLTDELAPSDVRCRVFKSGIEIQMDSQTLGDLSLERREIIAEEIAARTELLSAAQIRFAPYQMGSAFRHGASGEDL